MFSLTIKYILIQSTLKLTISQTDRDGTNRNETSIAEANYNRDNNHENDPTNITTFPFATSNANKDSDDRSENTTHGFTTVHLIASETPTKEFIAKSTITITEPETEIVDTKYTTKIQTIVGPDESLLTPSSYAVKLLSKPIQTNINVPTESSTTEKLTATTGQMLPIKTEHFSTFLKKLLILLSAKRSSDLKKLVEPFLGYVEDLSDAGELDVLGPDTKAFISEVVSTINDSTIYMLRYGLGELQLMLVNCERDSDDVLSMMDDMYEGAEEEDMQMVLRDVNLFPYGNKTGERIARRFVKTVLLDPMKRVAGTPEGDRLFSWITDLVNSRTTYDTKKILRQGTDVTETTKYVEKNDAKNIRIHSSKLHKRIRDNIENIENLLFKKHSTTEEEEEEDESNDVPPTIPETTNSYKTTLPYQAYRVKLANNNPKYSGTRNSGIKKIKHKVENHLNKRKQNVEPDLEKYRILKKNSNSNEDETFDKKDGTDKGSLILDDETDNEKLELDVDKVFVKPDPRELRTKFPFVNKVHKKRFIFPRKLRFTPKTKQEIRSNDKMEPLYETRKRRVKMYDSNWQYKKTSDIKYKKQNVVRNNKLTGNNKYKQLRDESETDSVESESPSSTEGSSEWTEDSSQDSELSRSSNEEDSEQSSDLSSTATKTKQARNNLSDDDYDYDNEKRSINSISKELPDQYRLTTKYRDERRKALEFELSKPGKSLEFYRRYDKTSFDIGHRSTVTENIATVFKATEDDEDKMHLKAKLIDFFRDVDFDKYNATQLLQIHNSTF